MRRFQGAYRHYDHFYILNAPTDVYDDMIGKTYWITHSERDWKVLLNLWEAFWLLKRLRPTVILSVGAGCIVPVCLIGKLWRIPTVYIETMASVKMPSLTGRIMYWMADRCLVQWEPLLQVFPKAEVTR